jgi:FixJ family two-component response regulator
LGSESSSIPRIENLQNVQEKPVVSMVDDDESVRSATTKLLRLNEYVVHTFASAEEFLRSPKLGDTRCLITDVRMPGISGLELQEQLIAQGRDIPIIFVTAYPEERSRERALSNGAVCFLNKPFDGLVLIRFIEQALGGQR